MLVFSKNKYISASIKECGYKPPIVNWVKEFDGKPVRKLSDNHYEQIGGHHYGANSEWVVKVDDKYLGR